MTASTRRRGRSLVGLATSALMIAGGLVLAPAAANAADETVDGGSLEWGFLASWRSYITGFIANGTLDTVAPATGTNGQLTYPNATGSIDTAAGTGTLNYEGAMNSLGHADSGSGGAYGLNQMIANPQIVITSTTTATLSYEVTQASYGGFPARNGEREVIADLSFPAGDLDDGKVSDAAATMTTAGSIVYGPANASYLPGAALDPVSFSFEVETPDPATDTTTTLAVSAASVVEGTGVGLTANVAPTDAAGTVTFTNNGTAIAGATDVAVAAGVASATGIVLPLGANSIVAKFTPADTTVYNASESAAQAVQVTATPAVETTTTVTNTAGPVQLGANATVNASVAAATGTDIPVGSVEFFEIADGTTTRVSLGSVDVDAAGAASVTTNTLAAGGHTFAAVFTPEDADDFAGSENATTANFGVVDPAAPTPYEPGANAQTSTGATASWDWNAYSADWTKIADGANIVLGTDGETFELSNGTVEADANGAVVSFTGTFRTQAYEGSFPTAGQWVEFIDPALHLNADGSGVWVAGVNTGIATYAANANAERLVIGEVDGYTGGTFGIDGERVASLAYADTTASGTWSAGKTGAWPNALVLKVPSAIRSFYYASGAGGDGNKPASDITVDFNWPAATTTTLSVAPASVSKLGADVALSATVTTGAEGTVTFVNTNVVTGTEVEIGEAAVQNGVAEITVSDIEAGGNSLQAKFTSTNGYLASESAVGAYRIVDTTQPELCAVGGSNAETLTGVSATWGWSAYSTGWSKFAGGNVTVDGQDFVLSNGVATVSDTCTSVAFEGTLRVEDYNSFFPEHGQWVELVNPTLVLDADGNGAWTAEVRSGSNALNTNNSERIAIVEIADASDLDFSENTVNASVEFAYDDTAASGTWKAGYDSAWSNGFVWLVPSSIQSFYYASGAGGDVNKPAADLNIEWAFDAQAEADEVLINGGTASEVEQGSTVTITGSTFRAGDVVSVIVNSDPVDLGTAVANAQGIASVSWDVPADFELGEHTATFTSTSTDATVAGTFSVVEKAATDGSDGGTGNAGGNGSSNGGNAGSNGSGSGSSTGATNGNTTGGLATTGSESLIGISVLATLVLLAGAGLMLARRRNAAQQ